MPELPEVEVLVRHLAPLLQNRKIERVQVRRAKVLLPTSPDKFERVLLGAKFSTVTRRGKYLLFALRRAREHRPILLVGHLGMTGRMYVSRKFVLPKHAAVVLDLGREQFIFEDTRYFGRLTLDASVLSTLGPEPLEEQFTIENLAQALKRSGQPIKVKLLDQSIVAGLGNIYASETLFRAGISPRVIARKLRLGQIERLWRAIRETLAEAIKCGSTVPLDYSGGGARDKLFYFGRTTSAVDSYEERLCVYDRAGQPCRRCGTAIKRIVQALRSTYYCPNCQRNR